MNKLNLLKLSQMYIFKKFIEIFLQKKKENVEVFVSSNGSHLFVLEIIEGVTALLSPSKLLLCFP